LKKYRLGMDIFALLLEHMNGLGYPERDPDAFIKGIAAGDFVVFLDALDEMPLHPGATAKDLAGVWANLFTMERARVVLSSRSALFEGDAAGCLPGFELMDLQGWAPDQDWAEFLRQHEGAGLISRDESAQLSRIAGRARELLDRPLYCKLVLEARDRVLGESLVNVAQLFVFSVERILERNMMVFALLPPEAKRVCMREIAFQMAQDDCRSLKVSELADYLNRKIPTAANPWIWEGYLNEIKVHAFLEKKGDWEFSHDAMREFFLAEWYLEKIEAGGDAGLDEAQEVSFTRETAAFVAGLRRLRPGPPLPEPGLERPRHKRNLALIRIAAAEGCRGWNLPGADFVGLDLREADFRDCNLQKALFLGADLRHADFRKADLIGAEFDDSRVYGVDFAGAHMDADALQDADSQA
jgi:hypothetical protein